MIDKDIALPQPRTVNVHFPFDDLDIGDSFLVSQSDPSFYRIRNLASKYNRETERNFTCRVVEGGIRVWRVK